MASKIVDYPLITDAIERLRAAGKIPSVTKIRAELGVGSYTTITKLFNQWKENNDGWDDQATPPPEDVPEEIVRIGEDFLRRIYSVAVANAQEEIHGLKEALRTRERELNADLEQALEMANESSEQAELLKDELEATKQRYSELSEDKKALQNAKEHAQQKLEGAHEELSKIMKELNEKNLQLATAIRQVEDAEKIASDQSNRLAEQTETLATSTRRCTSLEKENAELSSSLEEAKKAVALLEDEKERLNAQHATVLGEHQALLTERSTQEGRLQDRAETIQRLERELNQVREELAVTHSKLKDALVKEKTKK